VCFILCCAVSTLKALLEVNFQETQTFANSNRASSLSISN